MQDSIFRAYDIRGIVGTELIVDQVYNLARAIVAYCHDHHGGLTTVAVGMDGRTHSSAIKDELIRGLQDSGVTVIDVGLAITPIMYFSEYHCAIDGAFMVTASHNPPEYNGIKIRVKKSPIAGDQLAIIKEYFKAGKCIAATVCGSYQTYDMTTAYIEHLVGLFPHLMGSSYPLLFDCANASVGPVMRQLITRFQFTQADCLYEEVDGTYPHHVADPTELHNMQDLLTAIVQKNIPFGIGFDGDADRMGVIMQSGQLVTGDILLSGWARVLLKEHPEAIIVHDIKCSDGLQEVIQKAGGTAVMSPSGSAYIKWAMKTHGALLGGELSCHFFFADRYFGFDDGVYAALRLLELVTTYGTPLEEVFEHFPYRESSQEVRIACAEKSSAVIAHVKDYFEKKHRYHLCHIDGIRVATRTSWGLIRGSNTQPVICLRFEAASRCELLAIEDEFIEALEPFFAKEILQKYVYGSNHPIHDIADEK